MIISCCIRGFATKKASSESYQIARHASTQNLWTLGNGSVPSGPMRVAGWNVNGIRSVIKKKEFQPFLNQSKPDWLCLNETKVDLKAFQKQAWAFPEGYHQYWNFCKVSSGYSGVMVLTPHKPLSVTEDIPEQPDHSLEGRVIALQYEKFYLVNVYKPNAGRGLERLEYRTQKYDTAFSNYMGRLLRKKQVIIFGDMNVAHTQIDLFYPKKNKKTAGFTIQERAAFSQLLQLGFTDSYRHLYPERVQYSWWSNFSKSRQKGIGWRIDYILTSSGFTINQATVNDNVFGSDHCPVSAEVSL